MLSHDVVAGICPRSRLKTIHTRSSSVVFMMWLTYSCRNSGDINSLPPVSCIACCRETWSQHLNSPVSSWNTAQALILPQGLLQFGEHDFLSFRSSLLIGEHRGIIKITVQIKMRTYSASPEELWLDEWHSPVERKVTVPNIAAIRDELVDQTS